MSNNKNLTGWQRFMKSMTKANELGKEEDIMTDHDYDGIKELDNVLPPWWLYGFYITIVIAIFYIFQVFYNPDSYNQKLEFEAEVAQGKAEIEAYKKANPELFNTDVKLLTDAASLEAGKKVFTTYCVACHMADGGGGIGPNLTDDKWVLGGGIEKIFHVISEGGRPGKGMVAWKSSIQLKERQQVASYVISLQGTTPANPKAEEGDITWSKQ
ncbi:MAG: c-type cytochrome [Flavobacteriaceae bacterium]|nr:c-type cytochrome [Flavobacteriaceae bacterium]